MSWRKIKSEYIAGGISQRELSEKYGVGMPAIAKRSKKEKWVAKRKAAEIKSIEKVSEKTAEAVADNAVLIEKIKTGLLQRLVGMVNDYPDKNAAEIKKKENGALLIYRMKDIAAVLAVLEDKSSRGQSADMEDLAPLAELLRDE